VAEPERKRAKLEAVDMPPTGDEVLFSATDCHGGVTVNLEELEQVILKQEGQKADNAAVPTHIWENHFRDTLPEDFPPLHQDWRARLENYRTVGVRYWRICRLRSFWWYVGETLPAKVWRAMPHRVVEWDPLRKTYSWSNKGAGKLKYTRFMQILRSHPKTADDWEPARECLRKAASCTWWDWSSGSRLFFWEWPRLYLAWARDGQPHYKTKPLPTFRKPQQPPKNAEDRIMVWRKLCVVREREYIAPGKVTSLMHMFYMPKGKKDIRMVYNGTASRVNDCLFAAHFSLPTIQQVTRALLPGYYQVDMDIGEMFLNFMLGEELREYSGVDVTHVRTRHKSLATRRGSNGQYKQFTSRLRVLKRYFG
jgi:hypothetical protein